MMVSGGRASGKCLIRGWTLPYLVDAWSRQVCDDTWKGRVEMFEWETGNGGLDPHNVGGVTTFHTRRSTEVEAYNIFLSIVCFHTKVFHITKYNIPLPGPTAKRIPGKYWETVTFNSSYLPRRTGSGILEGHLSDS